MRLFRTAVAAEIDTLAKIIMGGAAVVKNLLGIVS
jgi:hypothetical protein